MAYKLFPFHNVHAAVGRNGVNRGDDVRLVQGLLDLSFGMRSLPEVQIVCKDLGGPIPKRKITVDGIYTDDIAAYIEMMQRTGRKKGKAYIVDGKASHVPHENGWFDLETRTGTGADYILVSMNATAIARNANGYLALGEKIGTHFMLGTLSGEIITV